MNRVVIPTVLIAGIILLISLQCTLTHRWLVWGVHMELLPPLLVYAAFTVNLPSSLLLGAFAAVMYDSFSAGPMGASLIPYLVGVSLFCGVRPIFFRNRISTQFFSGFVLGFIALFLQWVFCGKFLAGGAHIVPKLLHLSLMCAVLAVFYFLFLDLLFRGLGLNPGRFEDSAI